MREDLWRVSLYASSGAIWISAHVMRRLGLTKTGQGARVEAISRGVIGLIVPGGSEDVMIDLGVREALKLSKSRQASASKL